MTPFTSLSSPRRLLTCLALLALACAASGSGDGASSPDGDPSGIDCTALPACEELTCSGGEQCFKLERCPGFVCTDVKTACRSECGAAKCLVLESQPMLLSCR